MIKQSDHAARSVSNDVELLPDILAIAKSVRQLVGLKLAALDVAAGQDQMLLCLAEGTSMSVAEVADRLSVRASTISKMVDILERKGWVGRQADKEDARRVLVHLTVAGRQVRDEVRSALDELEAEVRAAIGVDRTMAPALAKLNVVLAKRLSRLR